MIILVIVYWLSNGQVDTHAIHAPSMTACTRNAPDIVKYDMSTNKKIVREKHICMEFT